MERLGLSAATRAVILVGDYGSGKTEIAVNLALQLAATQAYPIAIADLDLVNPYFRCREAVEPLERVGIRVVIPQGGHRFADLPILLPQGSRVLAGLVKAYRQGVHELWFVVNANRPFNDTVQGCAATISRIEGASGLRVTGLVPNTHLMQETTAEMVGEGIVLADQVAERLSVPVRMVAVMESMADAVRAHHPVLRMRRLMVPPWLRRDTVQLGRTGPEAFRLRST